LGCDSTSVDLLQLVCPPNFHFDQLDPMKGASLMKRFLNSCARLSRFAISISLGLTALATLGHTAAHAGTIYSLSNSLSGTSVQNGWTVSGSIELQDNTAFGAITPSDIKSWQWTATKPNDTALSATSDQGTFYDINGVKLYATASGIYIKDRFFALMDASTDKQLYYEVNTTEAVFQLFDFGVGAYEKFRVSPMDFPTDATYGYQFATPVAVPEPSTYAMALAGLACGGYSMFRRRKRV
jgi:hypothetical protein